MPTRCVPISLPVVESPDGKVANMDASQSQLSPVIFVNESQPLTPQRQQTRPVAEIRKLARYISDATDTDEFEASWQGRDLNDVAGHVQDSRGETVRCSLHDVKVKVASGWEFAEDSRDGPASIERIDNGAACGKRPADRG